MKRTDVISKLEAIATQVALPHNIEIVEVELSKGSGRSHLVRVYIDTPEGVTHTACALISRGMGAILDVEDPIDGTYELEVSSPGIERKLSRWKDWERFQGKPVKVVLKEPAQPKQFDATITAAEEAGGEHRITVELAGGGSLGFSFDQVDSAHLRFEW